MTALTYTCQYCRQTSTPTGSSCPMCGAPVDIRAQSTDGGWTKLPPISDMAHIQAGQSSVQVEGTLSPIADWNLAAGDSVYFSHQMLQWVDPSVTLDNMPMSKPWTRMRAGLPLIMAQATGPGPHRFRPRRARRGDRDPAAGGRLGRRLRAPAAGRHRQRRLRLERVGHLVLDLGLRVRPTWAPVPACSRSA